MIAASRNQGRVQVASAWAEFGRGAAAWIVRKPISRAVARSAFRATGGDNRSLECLS